MIIQTKTDIIPSEITPKSVFDNRREFIQKAGLGLIAGTASILSNPLKAATLNSGTTSEGAGKLLGRANAPAIIKATEFARHQKIMGYTTTTYGMGEKLTAYEDVTTYNNYYEFGTDKSEPVNNSKLFKPHPWTVSIEGEVKKNKSISIEDIYKLAPLEERIYRMRCVEGWSMVIPWIGFPLAQLVKWAEPNANAKYIEFISLADKQQMPGQNLQVLDWPYIEGLRMDEAMHPLTIMAVGLYGEQLPNQNGAPMRLVVPWKYGFKGAKAIVKIRFVEKMPMTSWMKAGPREYGFYANVNPQVEHPRWTQSSEKRIGAGLFAGRIKTQMFNGYNEQVGQLYAGLDLRKNF
ncbi:MAG: protein-methionine-sulfoxide reductase catalytic subunit MsrP [Methylotenera sp.]|uniref:protein-methionine-sulfoxide reductase catalytic subunit MsrP n=1 Tax=Methylotenera sp. TaxID=2051956 RepID=UPI0027279D4E|nr:protein-methionine-sulfoxide reductase catalytic subunit MsrP [Methylotenera sp.]MDO9394594.1 protein-methionine-sulfoxide reductase catalytic subunit MsrP [Methylotenera sp.]MDP3818356.1 protein-methionine-sulfoxide reductase catalytic subunit MsrP [Methylotenera sp.]MDZ4210886.1 protein-methionine-sulfoxide reductase catalytic subunit MsrP [Methylotenera sp.]